MTTTGSPVEHPPSAFMTMDGEDDCSNDKEEEEEEEEENEADYESDYEYVDDDDDKIDQVPQCSFSKLKAGLKTTGLEDEGNVVLDHDDERYTTPTLLSLASSEDRNPLAEFLCDRCGHESHIPLVACDTAERWRRRGWDLSSGILTVPQETVFRAMQQRTRELVPLIFWRRHDNTNPASVARIALLLRLLQWNEHVYKRRLEAGDPRLLQILQDQPEQEAVEMGVLPLTTRQCDICMDDEVTPDKMGSLSCNHAFCRDCWAQYLDTMLASQANDNNASFTCPHRDCTHVVTQTHIEELAPQLLPRLREMELQAFISGHSTTMRWCPGPDCGNVAVLARYNLLLAKVSRAVYCEQCQTRFCFDCGGTPHEQQGECRGADANIVAGGEGDVAAVAAAAEAVARGAVVDVAAEAERPVEPIDIANPPDDPVHRAPRGVLGAPDPPPNGGYYDTAATGVASRLVRDIRGTTVPDIPNATPPPPPDVRAIPEMTPNIPNAALPSAAPKNRLLRKCSMCNVMIEKTGGCNYMRCKCGHEFCWLCGERTTSVQFYGGVHFCGRLPEGNNTRTVQNNRRLNLQNNNDINVAGPLRRDNNRREWMRQRRTLDYGTMPRIQMDLDYLVQNCEAIHTAGDVTPPSPMAQRYQDLQRFAHYYIRFTAHEHGQNYAEDQCCRIESNILKWTQLSDVHSAADADFLVKANQTLVASRRMLKYTYCYAYENISSHLYEQDKDHDAISSSTLMFLDHQARLERMTEQLSAHSEDALTGLDRRKVLELIAIVEKCRQSIATFMNEDDTSADNASPERKLRKVT